MRTDLEDQEFYKFLCVKFNEPVQMVRGSPDCYGAHAHDLIKRNGELPKQQSIQYTPSIDSPNIIRAFIGGSFATCPDCNGYGEIDTAQGMRACQACSSHCLCIPTIHG